VSSEHCGGTEENGRRRCLGKELLEQIDKRRLFVLGCWSSARSSVEEMGVRGENMCGTCAQELFSRHIARMKNYLHGWMYKMKLLSFIEVN